MQAMVVIRIYGLLLTQMGKFPLADVSASGSLVHQSDVWNGAFLRRDLYLVNMLNWKCVEGVQNSRATLCLLVSEIPSSY